VFIYRNIDEFMVISDQCAGGGDNGLIYRMGETAHVVVLTILPSDELASAPGSVLVSKYTFSLGARAGNRLLLPLQSPIRISRWHGYTGLLWVLAGERLLISTLFLVQAGGVSLCLKSKSYIINPYRKGSILVVEPGLPQRQLEVNPNQ
jgi:hypothetical protein